LAAKLCVAPIYARATDSGCWLPAKIWRKPVRTSDKPLSWASTSATAASDAGPASVIAASRTTHFPNCRSLGPAPNEIWRIETPEKKPAAAIAGTCIAAKMQTASRTSAVKSIWGWSTKVDGSLRCRYGLK
jgi:hypothetical protein